MVGGIDYEWLRRQQEGIQLVTTGNAIRANRDGLPDRDTEGKVNRRALRRQAREVFASEGLWQGLRFVLLGKEYRSLRRRFLLITLPTIAAIAVILVCALRLWIPISPYREVGACSDIEITCRPFSEEKGCNQDLTLKNKGSDTYDFDGAFVMERKIAGIWRTLPVLEAQSAAEGYTLVPQGESVTVSYDWTEKYGWLEAGEYRLVIEAQDEQTKERYPMACEFTIFYLSGKH